MARRKRQTTETEAANVTPAGTGTEPVKKDLNAAAAGQDLAQQETEETETGGQEPDADRSNGTKDDKIEIPAEFLNMANATFKASDAVLGMIKTNAAEVGKHQQEILEAAGIPNAALEALQNTMYGLRKSIEPLVQAVKSSNAAVFSFFESEDWKSVCNSFNYFLEIAPKIISFSEEIEQLRPYFEEELKRPEYEGITLDELLYTDTTEAGQSDEIFLKALKAARAARDAEKEYAELPQLQSTGTPKWFVSPNTLLSNSLTADGDKPIIGGGAIDLPVLFRGTDKEITIFVNASLMDNNDEIKLTGKPYTEFDRAVQDAWTSLFVDRMNNKLPPVWDAEMIGRVMMHKTNTEKISPGMKGAITKSIEKQRRNIYIELDATNELRQRGILQKMQMEGKPMQAYQTGDFLLSARSDVFKAGGRKKTYYIAREPILYSYAKVTGQLLTFPGKLLDIKEVDKRGRITSNSISNNETRIAIKFYLLRRIEFMRTDEKNAIDAHRKYLNRRKRDGNLPVKEVSDFRKRNRTISLETLFGAVGITEKNAKTAAREYVLAVLNYWKAEGSRISGYKVREKKKALDAVIIEV